MRGRGRPGSEKVPHFGPGSPFGDSPALICAENILKSDDIGDKGPARSRSPPSCSPGGLLRAAWRPARHATGVRTAGERWRLGPLHSLDAKLRKKAPGKVTGVTPVRKQGSAGTLRPALN